MGKKNLLALVVSSAILAGGAAITLSVSDVYAAETTSVSQAADGNWYYYVDGEIDTSYTGLAPNSSGWWYIENGKVDFGFQGFVQNDAGWWYLEGASCIIQI